VSTALLTPPASAQLVSELLFSPDISVSIGSVPFDDEDLAYEDFITPISPLIPLPLPENVDVTGYHLDLQGAGHAFFSVNITAVLPGPLTVTPRDIVEYDFSSFSVAVDGDAIGIPAGARIDALTVDPDTGDFVVSFDGTVTLGTMTFADEDLVLLGGNSPTMYLDGSAAGLSESLDIDGASTGAYPLVAISLDGSGVVGGIAFDDEDILLHYKAGGTWYMAYDASSHAFEMEGGPDTDAIFVPEPNAWLLWASGTALLATLARRRSLADVEPYFALRVPALSSASSSVPGTVCTVRSWNPTTFPASRRISSRWKIEPPA
jgi:hypothetical protein